MIYRCLNFQTELEIQIQPRIVLYTSLKMKCSAACELSGLLDSKILLFDICIIDFVFMSHMEILSPSISMVDQPGCIGHCAFSSIKIYFIATNNYFFKVMGGTIVLFENAKTLLFFILLQSP